MQASNKTATPMSPIAVTRLESAACKPAKINSTTSSHAGSLKASPQLDLRRRRLGVSDLVVGVTADPNKVCRDLCL